MQEQYFEHRYEIPVVSVAAYSGTGKTTFLEKLIPALKGRGLRVAVLKHDGHDFEIDKEGKDSYRMTKAGADVTCLISAAKAVLMENRPVDPMEWIRKITDVDLIIVEGYKQGPWPKILLYRKACGKPLAAEPGECLAVVSDEKIGGCDHFFAWDDVEKVADFLEEEVCR